jgi:ABC-type transporter Mla subunit MlaD
METWVVVGVTLLGVLVGFTLPALIQAYLTLRSARTLMDRLGPKLDATLTEVRQATQRINRAGSGLETSVKRTQSLFRTVGDLSDSLQRLRGSLRTAAAVGAALGPALAAGLKALGETDAVPEAEAGGADGKPDPQPAPPEEGPSDQGVGERR